MLLRWLTFIFLIPSVLISQNLNKVDSLLKATVKDNPVAERDWLSFNRVFTSVFFKSTKDSILEEVEVVGQNDIEKIWLKKLKSPIVTFYYITPSADEDDWVSVSVCNDQFEKELFNSSKYSVVSARYGRATLYRYSLEIKGNIKGRINIKLEQNCIGRWIVVTNANEKLYPISQTYTPDVPRESKADHVQTSEGQADKVLCSECKGKGTVVEDVEANCAKCWGKGTVSCSACGGSGRLYTRDRSRSEYCSFCHGSGTKSCLTCNGTGKRSSKLPKKCSVCNGTKYINKNK